MAYPHSPDDYNYGPPPSYPSNDNTPTKKSFNNGSTMRLLNKHEDEDNNKSPRVSTGSAGGSPYDVFARARDRLSGGNLEPADQTFGAPTPSAAVDSDLGSLLQEVEESITKTKKRPKFTKVRFKSRDGTAKDEPKASSLPASPRPTSPARSYQPGAGSRPVSREPSILDNAPEMRPTSTGIPTYLDYRPSSRSSQQSPTRPWSPSRGSSEYPRPRATNVPYEPADINGSPRPGTPSTQYTGGSPKRPLPPAPLFAGGRPLSSGGDKEAPEMTAISIDGDDDDVFSPEMGESDIQRPSLKQHDSFMSASTFTDELYDEKDEELYGPAPSGKVERRGASTLR